MSNHPESQSELFSTPKPASTLPKVTIALKGLGPVPSFKTGKRAFAWIDTKYKPPQAMTYEGEVWLKKRTINVMARPITLPEHQKWMEEATSRIESQLRSFLATTGAGIQTAASPRSLIATLLPLDDCWTNFREVLLKSELCAPGHEGAVIQIERL